MKEFFRAKNELLLSDIIMFILENLKLLQMNYLINK